ncbi:hypothetical protein ACIQB5_42355 [Streptomyces sp. NPDC088560]|uniref:hypothetical protein n=1 Tax=Streptomyces sp. NPDC088560 TaxID=3365868 RepID=UPI003814AF44
MTASESCWNGQFSSDPTPSDPGQTTTSTDPGAFTQQAQNYTVRADIGFFEHGLSSRSRR